MKKVWIIIVSLVLITVFLNIAGFSCANVSTSVINETTTPTTEKLVFNLIFKYGDYYSSLFENRGWVLDTYNGTFTRGSGFCQDPPVTIKLTLTEQEKISIYQKMLEIDFFNDFIYPTTKFSNILSSASVSDNFVWSGAYLPTQYYFYVEYNTQVKELSWCDDVPAPLFEGEPGATGNITLQEVKYAYRENNLYWLINQEEKYVILRELSKFIIDIIESKEEYKNLPEPPQCVPI